jgi:hypothetical protein
LAAALLALTAASLIAPASANASCGAHTLSGSNPFDMPALKGLERFDSGATSAGEGAPIPPRRRSPCAGMSCSQAPSLPLVPGSNGATRIDQWGCLDAPAPINPESYDIVLDDAEVHPRHVRSSLERPPRRIPSRSV